MGTWEVGNATLQIFLQCCTLTWTCDHNQWCCVHHTGASFREPEDPTSILWHSTGHRKIAKRHWVRRLNRNVFRALKLWCDRSQKIRFMILQKTRHARRAQQRLWFTKWLQFTSRLKSDKRVAFMQRRYITKFFERRKWNQLRSHFDTLKHWYTSVKMDKAEEKNRMRLLKKVVGRFRHGRLGMTLRSWIE